jgi:hypothetical protein
VFLWLLPLIFDLVFLVNEVLPKQTLHPMDDRDQQVLCNFRNRKILAMLPQLIELDIQSENTFLEDHSCFLLQYRKFVSEQSMQKSFFIRNNFLLRNFKYLLNVFCYFQLQEKDTALNRT